MSWLKDLDPALVGLVLDGVEELASFVIHKIRGDGSEADDVGKAAVAEIKRKALLAMVAGLEAEAANQAAILGIPDRVEELQLGQADVLDAFTPKGTIPPLGIEVVELPPDA